MWSTYHVYYGVIFVRRVESVETAEHVNYSFLFQYIPVIALYSVISLFHGFYALAESVLYITVQCSERYSNICAKYLCNSFSGCRYVIFHTTNFLNQTENSPGLDL